MTWFLGVDGGNSKTLAVLADERGEIAGVGRAGSGSHQTLGLEGAMREIRSAAAQALAMGGVQPGDVEAAYYTLAGADFPEDFDLLLPALRELGLSRQVGLHNDSFGGLWSGTSSPNAVVVIAGSGTNAAGRNAEGQELRLPAVGWYSGDWGGGGELAREAVFLSARAHDGRGEPTMLQQIVLDTFDQPDMDSLIQTFYHQGVRSPDFQRRFHELVPGIFRAAAMGDAVARALIERQGHEVVTMAVALLRRLGLMETPADVVLAGSVFKGEGPLLLNTIRQDLAERAPLAGVVLPSVEPAVGALFGAMDMAGVMADDAIRDRARDSYDRLRERMEARV